MAIKNKKAKKAGRGRKPKKAKGKDVVKTHVQRRAVRVPINQTEAQRKERQIREKLTEVAHLEADIKPLANQKRALAKEIKKLAEDVEKNSEERDMDVYLIKDYPRHNVQVVRADNDEVVEEHTMTPEEAQRDVEEDAPGTPPKGAPGGPEDEEEPEGDDALKH